MIGSPRSMKVRIVGDQTGAIIRGVAPRGARVEAINLSLIPAVRRRPEETLIIAVADEKSGRFEGRLDMLDGDLVRVRARARTGKLTPWTTFRARGLGTARPRPEIALPRIALRDLGDGRVK